MARLDDEDEEEDDDDNDLFISPWENSFWYEYKWTRKAFLLK